MTTTADKAPRYTVLATVCYGPGVYASWHRTLAAAGRAIIALERRGVVIGHVMLVDAAREHCTADATHAAQK